MSPFTPRGGVIGTPVEGIGDVPGLTAALAALQEAATAATDTELSDAAETLQTAIDTKQGAATAATDTELTAAMATVQLAATAATDSELSALSASVTTALGLKADASSVATDAELAAAVATLNTAVGLKQDASTAATDTELAGVEDTLSAAIAAIPSGDVALFAEEPVSPADGQAWLEAAGGEWLSGSAAPTADDGHDGDFYWRYTTGEVYGPKAAGAWPASVAVLDQAAINAKSVADRAYADTVGGSVELGYASITTNASTSTTGADVAGLSITVTVGARPILLVMAGTLSNSNGAGASIMNMQEGATVVGQASLGAVAANLAFPLHRVVRLAPSAGSHTYKVNLSSFGAGTVTLAATAANPAYIQALQI